MGQAPYSKEQAEAALYQTCAMLDELGLDYIVYIRTHGGFFGRRIKFKSAKDMVNATWSISIDLGETVHSIAEIAAEEVDRRDGINS